MSHTRFLFGAVPCILVLSACTGEPLPEGRSAAGATQQDDSAPVISIEELYSRPSIIGTSPEGAAWSPDGKVLAFLWNDTGLSFRDVWTWTVDGGSMTRLSRRADGHDEASEHPGISEVAWLDDNQRLAYVLDGRIWLVDGEGESTAVEGVAGEVHDLRLSPAGRHLAFVADGSLWIMGTQASGVPRAIADPGEERIFIERYQWSSDGRRLVFVQVDNREVRQIEIHYDSGGESRVFKTTRAFPGDETPKRKIGIADVDSAQITWYERPNERHPVWGFGLSADGRRLFIDSSDFLIKERTIYVYDVATGKREAFFESQDPKKVMPGWSAAWAPDDEGLIILSDHGGWFHLYDQPDAGSEARQLTSGPWEIASFEVDSKNGLIYFLANKSHTAELQIYRVSMDGGEVERISSMPGTHAPVFSPGFELAADRFSNDVTPPDLYLQDLANGTEAQRITDSPGPEFDELPLAEVSYVEFNSHVDGTPLLGRLSLPQDYEAGRRYPVPMGSIYPNSVRNRWGAGNAIPTWGLDQHLVERGYVLMKVDVRGSWGHGKKVRQGLFRDYGGIDKDDVQSGAMHLIDVGIADPERVGIWGWSYGGLMTLMSLFHKPDFYAVGIADAPATNVAHAFPEQMWVMGRPEGEDFPARYERMSALYHSAGLSKPLMITHATKDAVVLYSDTIALAERMIANGKTFELVTLPGSSHVWANDSSDQQRFGYRKMVEFFDRHLEP